ncbi:MAG: PEP-CTERM sorting domain-containing protein [Deltaproteobacteria bacterium]|nr:PEP-CTERM sorting domain-containing protein [Deltaproteobacteria bacterium]
MKKIVTILSTVLLAVFMLMTGVGQATPIQGALWDPADTFAENPGIGPPGGSPNATFTVNSLDFDSARGTFTYDTWLKGAPASNPNGLVWVSDPDNIKNSFYTSSGHGTFFQFTGTAFFPANVAIRHDDGFWLDLGGTIYDHSGPTVAITDYLGNLPGTYTFTLRYGAWNDFPEVLQAQGVSSVPEPITMLLVGFGMLGVAGIRRKLRS